MMCYKDMTFCNFGPLCSNWECDRRLTDEIKKDAEAFGLPVAVFTEFPDCFEPFFTPKKYQEDE